MQAANCCSCGAGREQIARDEPVVPREALSLSLPPVHAAFFRRSHLCMLYGLRNIAAIKASLAHIAGFDSPGLVYGGDTFFIAGGNSNYVRARHLERIRELFPVNTIVTVRGCGHWVHSEAPADTVTLIMRYINRDRSGIASN